LCIFRRVLLSPGSTLSPYTTLFRSAEGNTGSEQDFLDSMKGSWMLQGTTDKADDNTDAIYQEGAVAIGKDEGIADVMLDVAGARSEEHTSELQSRFDLVCRLLLEKK